MSAAYPDAQILVDALREPESVAALDNAGWTALLTMARAEQLIGTLAHRLEGQPMPTSVRAIIDDAKSNAEYQRRSALWEADRAAAALKNYSGKVILMKGTAYHAAALRAAEGRHVGDLDIMAAEANLEEVEMALLAAGWEWVKEDDYDDAYYREHMHELPPLIHKERDRMIDVHHTILPRTARPSPDAAAMIDAAVPLGSGGQAQLYVFASEDMVLHCVAHLIADGDLAGGLRNLWDLHCLLTEFTEADEAFWTRLGGRAELHGLTNELARALRLSRRLFGTQINKYRAAETQLGDYLFLRRLLARNGYGRQTRKFTRFAFYLRSHWLRMPPLMLARHLWTKWRKGHQPKAGA